MNIKYKLDDFIMNSFMHTSIQEVYCDVKNRIFKIKFRYLDLKKGGCLYGCNIIMSDWLDFEVIEVGKKVHKKYSNDEIPTNIFQVFEYRLENDILTFFSCGTLDIDTEVQYIFTKPKIEVDGEYDHD